MSRSGREVFMPFVPDRLSLLPQACFRTSPGIGSISGHDRADTGQGWRTSPAKMAYIPGGGRNGLCEGGEERLFPAISVFFSSTFCAFGKI